MSLSLYGALKLFAQVDEASVITVASAATTDIGTPLANSFTITGSATITSLGIAGSGAFRRAVFTGSATLTYNATSLILPTAASIVTAANDSAMFLSLGSGNWQCISYLKGSGASLTNAALAVVAVSSNITLAGSTIYLCDTSATRSLQLPAPLSAIKLTIKDKTGAAQTNNITVVRFAAEKIETVAASYLLDTNLGSWDFVSDGVDWFVI